MNSIRWFCLVLWLGIAAQPGFAQEPPATGPLVKGDGLLVHIEGLGGNLPEYREIVDSDGNIELPFIGLLPAAGKLPAEVASQMAAAYSNADLSPTASVHITYVTHFEPPPARTNLVRSQDPRRPVAAGVLPTAASP